MQLPSHIQKRKAQQQQLKNQQEGLSSASSAKDLSSAKPKTKYSDTAVKMLVTAIDDVHMIKFKAGWFTLVKYDYEVFEKGNSKLRQELVDHAKMVKETPIETRLVKPETWLSQKKLSYCGVYSPGQAYKSKSRVNSQAKSYMVEESKVSEVTPVKIGEGAASQQKPKSQSKVALKRQRMAHLAAQRNQSMATAQATAGSMNPSTGLVSFKKNFSLKLGKAALNEASTSEAHEMSQPNFNNDSQNLRIVPQQQEQAMLKPNSESIINNSVAQIKPMQPQIGSQNQDPYNDAVVINRNTMMTSTNSTPQINPGAGKDTILKIKPSLIIPNLNVPSEQSLSKPELSGSVSNVSIKPDPSLPTQGLSGQKAATLQLQSSLSKSSYQSQNAPQMQEMPRVDGAGQDTSDKHLPIIREVTAEKTPTPIQTENLRFFFTKFQKIIKRRYFAKYRAFTAENRQQDFKSRIENYFKFNKEKRDKRMAFEQFRINQMSLKVQEAMQDKFQLYARYIRRLWSICETQNQRELRKDAAVKSAFIHWKAAHKIVKKLKTIGYEQARKNQEIEQRQNDIAKNYLIKSVHLHRNSINLIQNQQIVYVKEQTENDHNDQALVLFAMVMAKFEKIQKMQKIGVFRTLKQFKINELAHSMKVLNQVKQNIQFLQNVKKSHLTGVSMIAGQSNLTNDGKTPITIKNGMSQYDQWTELSSTSYLNPLRLNEQQTLDHRQTIPLKPFSQMPDDSMRPQMTYNQTSQKHTGMSKSIQMAQSPDLYAQVSGAHGQKNNFNEMVKAGGKHNPYSIAESSSFHSIMPNSKHLRIEKAKMNLSQESIEGGLDSARQSKMDKDDIFLINVERHITENFQLLKLFENVQKEFVRQRKVVDEVEEDTITLEVQQQMTMMNKQKIVAIGKLLSLNFRFECLRIQGQAIDCRGLATRFSQWCQLTERDKFWKMRKREEKLATQRIKLGLQRLHQKFNNCQHQVQEYFQRWAQTIYAMKIQQKGINGIDQERNRLKRLRHSTLVVDEKSKQVISHNISYSDQKHHQKITSFMKIESLFQDHYISRGTILQKFINNLKFLAQQQLNRSKSPATGKSANAKNPNVFSPLMGFPGIKMKTSKASSLDRQEHAQQAVIEDNVNRIILGIQKIVFNKWVLFTHHQIKYVTQPRLMGAQKMLNAIHQLFVQKKVYAIKIIHLYSLQIEEQQNDNGFGALDEMNDLQSNGQQICLHSSNQQSINEKLEDYGIAMLIIKGFTENFNSKVTQKYFNNWKMKAQMYEWRMSQTMNSQKPGFSNPNANLLMSDSQNMTHVLENLRQHGAINLNDASMRTSDASPFENRRASMPTDLDLQQNSEKGINFFENYFTPKSAAIQQKLQKPWEIKQQREKIQINSIYRGCVQAEAVFKRQYNQKDQTLMQLNHISMTRIEKIKAFRLWQAYTITMRSIPQRKEFAHLAKILAKIQRHKIARRFMYWKIISRLNDDTYPLLTELVDQGFIRTQAQIENALSAEWKKKKDMYKQQLVKKSLTRMFEYMRVANPVRVAFMQWKNEDSMINSQAVQIWDSQDQNDELKNQYIQISKLNIQLKKELKEQIKENLNNEQSQISNRLPSPQQGCQDCCRLQYDKINDISKITYNQELYQELNHLIGKKGLKDFVHSIKAEINDNSDDGGSQQSDNDYNFFIEDSQRPPQSSPSSVMQLLLPSADDEQHYYKPFPKSSNYNNQRQSSKNQGNENLMHGENRPFRQSPMVQNYQTFQMEHENDHSGLNQIKNHWHQREDAKVFDGSQYSDEDD